MKGRLVFWHMSVKQWILDMWILANAGFCFAVLIKRRVRVSHAFCLPMKKMDFYVLIVHVFVHTGFTVQVLFRLFPWHLFLKLQIHIIFFFFLLLIMSFSVCKCIWLLLIDSSAQDDIILLELELLGRLQTLACHPSVFPQPCGGTLCLYFLVAYFSVAVLWTPSDLPVFAALHRYSRGMDCFCWTFLSQNKRRDFLLQNCFLPFFPCRVPLYYAYCGLLHSAHYFGVYIFI